MSELKRNVTFNSQTGSFNKINLGERLWFQEAQKFNENHPEEYTEFKEVYKAIYRKDGTLQGYEKVYQVYKNGVVDFDATEKLQEATKLADLEDLGQFLFSATGLKNFSRSLNGVDPITGEVLTNNEMTLSALMGIIEVADVVILASLLGKLQKAYALKETLNIADDVAKITKNSKYPDLYDYQYNGFENPGPLAEMDANPLKNFYGGRYNKRVLTEELRLFRGGEAGGLTIPGKERNAFGQWFTNASPESVAKVRIDTAVKPQWINPKTGKLEGYSVVNAMYEVKIPKGTPIYEGPVGFQSGIYSGGLDNTQIFISEPWKIRGIEIIKEVPLK